ncbi:MAG TPA: FAD-dependent oxidoreductase, partial [Thermoanaerobaculia bacterium]|nr:FAD-dependent oxidoreductase [Thermoanaerobaculia bacterium]
MTVEEQDAALDTILRTWSVPLDTRLESGEGVGPHLYVLGSLEHRVTILAQQIRALNLIAAIEARANLSPVEGKSVAVIGAGIAGTTAALAAQRAGFKTHLFDQYSLPFPLLRSGQTRWLHPHIYDWPNPGWENPSADLPILTWKAGSAAEVVEQLDRQWQVSLEAASPVLFRGGVKDFAIRNYEWESAEHLVTWEEKGLLATGRYSVIILALGFGEERDIPEIKTTSYWQDSGFVVKPHQRLHILVVGDGDGGLIDTLRARFHNFRQEALHELLGFDGHELLEREVLHLENELVQNRLRPLDLAHQYGRLTNISSLDTALAKQLRSDTRVTIVGRSPNMMNPKATPLHRLLVQRLLEMNKSVEFHQASVTRITPTTGGANKFRAEFEPTVGASVEYDQVVVRAGPRAALASSFKEIYKAMLDSYASTLSLQLPSRLWISPSSMASPAIRSPSGSSSDLPAIDEGPFSEGKLLEVLSKLEQKWPDPYAETIGYEMVQRELDLIKRDP